MVCPWTKPGFIITTEKRNFSYSGLIDRERNDMCDTNCACMGKGEMICFPDRDAPPAIIDCPRTFRGLVWAYIPITPDNMEFAKMVSLRDFPEWETNITHPK